MTKLTRYGVAGAAGLVALAAGCAKDRPEDTFFPEPGHSQVTAIADAQAARGARADGMLFEDHFSGPHLNALGRAKLDSMMGDDDAPSPMVVYVAAADTDLLAQREGAVAVYLKESGLEETHFRTERGINPGERHRASEGLSRMGKTENPAGQQGQDDGTATVNVDVGAAQGAGRP